MNIFTMLALILSVAVCTSCSKSAPKVHLDEEIQMTNTVAKVREGMTFLQISSIIPLSTNIVGFSGEHGGVWYDVPIASNYFVQLRFEHPASKKNPSGPAQIQECKLNYPPRIKRYQ